MGWVATLLKETMFGMSKRSEALPAAEGLGGLGPVVEDFLVIILLCGLMGVVACCTVG